MHKNAIYAAKIIIGGHFRVSPNFIEIFTDALNRHTTTHALTVTN